MVLSMKVLTKIEEHGCVCVCCSKFVLIPYGNRPMAELHVLMTKAHSHKSGSSTESLMWGGHMIQRKRSGLHTGNEEGTAASAHVGGMCVFPHVDLTGIT